jgi:WD40 repeat protein
VPNIKPGIGNLNLTHDGKTLLVSGIDGKIRFVDLGTGEVKRTFSAHSNSVYIATLNSDGKLLASSSRDRTAKIWDFDSGRELKKFDGFRCAVKAVSFSPDGRLLAASGNDGMLKLWDVKTGTELKSLVHRDSLDMDMAIYAFVFSRDGKQIYGGNGDGTISIWDIATGKELRNWKASENTVFKLIVSPDYRRLISLGNASVKVWDTTTWREIQALSLPENVGISTVPSTLAVSHDGQLIAASYIQLDPKQNTYVAINTIAWDAKSGEKRFTFSGQKFDVNGLIFTRDDRVLLTGSVDTTIKFWDMRNGQLTRTLTMH